MPPSPALVARPTSAVLERPSSRLATRGLLLRAFWNTAIVGALAAVGAAAYLQWRGVVSFGTALLWQGAIYGAWVPIAVALAWVFDRARRVERQWRAYLLAWWPVTLLHATVSAIASWTVLHRPREVSLRAYLPGQVAENIPVEILQYWALVAVLALVELSRRLHERDHAVARLEAEVTRAQLAALRARLQPHFLFNTLQSIAMLIPREPETAQRMTLNLGDLLRAAFARGDAQEVRLADELALARAYVEIEAQRFRDRLAVRWCVDEAPPDARVPDLVLQPLVENALRHGLWPRPGRGTLTVRAGVRREGTDGERLLLEVEDDGAGLPATWQDGAADGTGLGATRARLLALYGDRARLEVGRAAGGGTLARVELPLGMPT